MTNKKSSSKTLIFSIIMSSPGPLVLGLALIASRSSTQIADFVRRSAELLAIIVAFVVYTIIAKNNYNEEQKSKLEKFSNLFAGAIMCLAGSIMLALAFFINTDDKGNVIPGLAIAVLGLIANSIFWIKYSKLYRVEQNKILQVQARLYRAKTLVDSSVTIALLSVLIASQSSISYYLDFVGSIIVAVYLVWCGIQTVFEALKQRTL